MYARRFAFLLMLSVSLAACSSLNPFADPPKTKPTELVDFSSSLNVKPLWQISLGDTPAGALTAFGTSTSMRAYVAAGSNIRVVDLSNGSVLLTAPAPERLTSGVGTDGDVFSAATRGGEIVTWGADGTIKWRSALNAEVLASPAIADGIIAALTTDGRLIGFDQSTGKRRWVLQRPAPALTLRAASPVVAVRNGFIVGFPGGRILAVSARDGQARWEAVLASGRGANEVERIADIAASVGILNETICLSSYQGKVGCIAVRDGRLQWDKEFSSPVGVSAAGNTLYGTDEKSIVHALSGSGGAALWKQDKLLYRTVTAPAALGATVVVGDYKGMVHFLSAANGNFMARVATDGSAISGPPLAVETGARRLIFVQTAAGGLFAFEIQ